jgi:ribosomal protein S3AE
MAQGKSKKSYGKKGAQKKNKQADTLSKKQWFQLRAPAPFQA